MTFPSDATNPQPSRPAAGGATREQLLRQLPSVYDFALRVTLSEAAALEVSEAAFKRATADGANRPRTLSLAAWLLGIARDEALDGIRQRSRPDSPSPEAQLSLDDRRLAQPRDSDVDVDLALWTWQAARSQRPRDYSLLDLTVRRRIMPEEAADIASLTRTGVYAVLGRLRGALEESFASSALFHAGRKDCSDLAATVGDATSPGPALRREISRHIEQCNVCRQKRDSLPRAADILAGLQDVPVPLSLVTSIERMLAGLGAGVQPSTSDEEAGEAAIATAATAAVGTAAAPADTALATHVAPQEAATVVEEAAAEPVSAQEEQPGQPATTEARAATLEEPSQAADAGATTPPIEATAVAAGANEALSDEPTAPADTVESPAEATAAPAEGRATAGEAIVSPVTAETPAAAAATANAAEAAIGEETSQSPAVTPQEVGPAGVAAPEPAASEPTAEEKVGVAAATAENGSSEEATAATALLPFTSAEPSTLPEPIDEAVVAPPVAAPRDAGAPPAPPRPTAGRVGGGWKRNLLIGAGVAALAGVVYLGVALGDSISSGGGSPDDRSRLPTPVPGLAQLACGAQPARVNQGSRATLVFTQIAQSGQEIASVNVQSISQGADVNTVRATAQRGRTVLFETMLRPGSPQPLDEYRVVATFEGNNIAQCTVQVAAPQPTPSPPPPTATAVPTNTPPPPTATVPIVAPTPTVVIVPTPSPTPEPLPTDTPEPTATPTDTPSPTLTPSPTGTPPTFTPSPTFTSTPVPFPTPTPTGTLTPVP